MKCSPLCLSLLFIYVWTACANQHLSNFGLREQDAVFQSRDNIQCDATNECDEAGGAATDTTAVCGNNGETVEGRCKFIRKMCKNNNLEFLHFGHCTMSEKCFGQQRVELQKEAEGDEGLFIPKCNSMGYALGQCHQHTNYCWCSQPDGTPIQKTVTREGEPHCSEYIALFQHSSSGGGSSTSSRHSGGCEKKRRQNFNANMIAHFKEEYLREHATDASLSDSALQLQSLGWKFEQLDTKSDGKLVRKEFIGIQKMVRKVVKPEKCAKKFPRMCDVDMDKHISLKEWTSCFSSSKTKNNRSTGPKKGRSKKGGKVGKGKIKKPRPCDHEQRQANETRSSAGNQGVYVPACEKNGFYKPKQCYGTNDQSIWYCFCVNIYTGSMIKNTYIPNEKPRSCPIIWPKCPPPDKSVEFLRELVTYLADYVGHPISRKVSLKSFASGSVAREIDEAVEAIFDFLDTNHNESIDKKEKKHLKKILRKRRSVWRCGRKLHKVCDMNSDRRISRHEFAHCVIPTINASDKNSVVDSNVAKLNKKRGKNPFIDILKSDSDK